MKEKLNFSEAELKNNSKWKTKKELQMLIKEFHVKKTELNKIVEDTWKELSRFTAITPCSNINLESELPAKQTLK